MSEQVAADSHYRFQLRVPGWLLALALLLAAGWWGGRCVADVVDGSDGGVTTFPSMRVTALDASFEDRALVATVLVEANDQFDPGDVTFAITLDDRTPFPAAARARGGGAWNGRSYVMVIERLLPEGRIPEFLVMTSANGSFGVELKQVLDR